MNEVFINHDEIADPTKLEQAMESYGVLAVYTEKGYHIGVPECTRLGATGYYQRFNIVSHAITSAASKGAFKTGSTQNGV